ncbi:MAG: hypothetical protein WCR54_04340 [Clostridia bacterium]
MDNNNNYQRVNNGMPMSTPNGQEGTWVPVDASSLPFTVGGEMNQPTIGPDGAYYCVGQSAPNYGPIVANQYNAIPTPSAQIQMPAIVQPIALVPYASQNQPLVQYNPNYQPDIPMGNANDPVYKAKPYSFLSVLLVMIGSVAGVVLSLLSCLVVGGTTNITGIDAILSYLQKFGVGTFDTHYYSNVFGPYANSADVLTKIVVWAFPIIFALLLLFAVVLVIKYLAKLGKRKSPRCFSLFAFIGFILSVACLVFQLMSATLLQFTMEPGIGMYVICGTYFLLFILPFFAKRGAVVLDFESSKRVYAHQ